MAIRATRTFTRPNTNTMFYQTTPEWKSYSKTAYTDTGLRTLGRVDQSDDGLVSTTITEWRDQAAFDTFMADPQVASLFLNPRQAFCEENGIIISNFTFETI